MISTTALTGDRKHISVVENIVYKEGVMNGDWPINPFITSSGRVIGSIN